MDPRHAPFLEFMYEQYQFHRDGRLVLDAHDIIALKSLLARTATLPDYDIEQLKLMWMVLMVSTDRLNRKQRHPLAFFCENITNFAIQVKASGQTMNAGTVEARQWLRGKVVKHAVV